MKDQLAAVRDIAAAATETWPLSRGVFQPGTHNLLHLENDCPVLGRPGHLEDVADLVRNRTDADAFRVCDRCLGNYRSADSHERAYAKGALQCLLETYAFTHAVRDLEARGEPKTHEDVVEYARILLDAGRAFTDDTVQNFLDGHGFAYAENHGVELFGLHEQSWQDGKQIFDRLVAAKHVTSHQADDAQPADRLAVLHKGAEFWADLGLRRAEESETLWYAQALEAPRRGAVAEGFLAEVTNPPKCLAAPTPATFVPPDVTNPQAYTVALDLWDSFDTGELYDLIISAARAL
jgi:hypothetical protein